MSIIYDALKKVEKSNSADLKANIAKAASGPPSRRKIYLLYILASCLVFITANMLFGFFTRPLKDKAAVAVAVPSSSPPLPSGGVVPNPAPVVINEVKKPAAPSFVLNGVFFSEDQGYALINNQIVKEGDKVEGATVERIDLDSVELKFEDQAIKLTSKNN